MWLRQAFGSLGEVSAASSLAFSTVESGHLGTETPTEQ